MVYIKRFREDNRPKDFQTRTSSMRLPDENKAELTQPEMWSFHIVPAPTDIKTAVAGYELRCKDPDNLGFKFDYVIDEADLKDFNGNLEAHAKFFHMQLLQTLELKYEEMKERAANKMQQAAAMLEIEKMKASNPDAFKGAAARAHKSYRN